LFKEDNALALTEEFLAREALIARAGIDEDWLASLGLALVPAWEVIDPGHRDAILAAMLDDAARG
jgi:hypothetical protein